jgi:polar amino acid transport system substrate-binding protein
MTRRFLPIALLAALVALAGCGSHSDEARRASLAAIGTPLAAAPASPKEKSVDCKDPTASLRPPATMPRPGAMPAGSFMEKIQQKGTLVAGVDQNTLLLSYYRPATSRMEGFEVDLLRAIGGAIGVPVEFKAVTTIQRPTVVRSGAVDIVADAYTVNCARRRQLDFSTIYYDTGQRVLVPKKSTARGLDDLGGKRVCATTGSTTLNRVARNPAKPIPYPVAQRTDCLVALQEGRVDAISSDETILLGFKAQDSNTKIVGRRLSDEPYGMAIARSHPEFVRFVNGVLERMRRDGTLKALERKWIGRLGPTPEPPRPRYSD